LKAGVYHFNPYDFAWSSCAGGFLDLISALVSDEPIASSPFTIVMIHWLGGMLGKYEARSYRHWFWTRALSRFNLLTTCASEGLTCKLVLGFVDSLIDKLLGLEESKEATVGLAVVGAGLGPHAQGAHKERSRRFI